MVLASNPSLLAEVQTHGHAFSGHLRVGCGAFEWQLGTDASDTSSLATPSQLMRSHLIAEKCK